MLNFLPIILLVCPFNVCPKEFSHFAYQIQVIYNLILVESIELVEFVLQNGFLPYNIVFLLYCNIFL